MSGYPSITYHNPTSICGKEKWKRFRAEGLSTDIIAICETWFHWQKEDRVYNDRYNGFFCDRRQKENQKPHYIRGGCALWLDKNSCTEQSLLFRSNAYGLEALCVRFQYRGQQFAVLVIYSPPGEAENSRSKKNTKFVQKMLVKGNELNIPEENYIVMGDFNKSTVTLGTEDQFGVTLHEYSTLGNSQSVSELDKIYGTRTPRPYSDFTVRDPQKYNLLHKTRTKAMHKILELR